jgi:hypothetical protein
MNPLKFVLAFFFAVTLLTLPLEIAAQEPDYSYAYISVHGKIFSKKLKVEVDLGDSPEQIAEAEEYSQQLTDKKSYAAILNHLVANGFELVETLDASFAYQDTGTTGIVFIMKRKKGQKE